MTDEIPFTGKLNAGLSSELKRLQDECARSFREFQDEPSPIQRVALQKIYLAYVAAMRQLAKPASAAELEAKNLIAVAEVEATWTRALQEFRTSLEAIPRRVATHALFKKLDLVDVEELLRNEVNAVLTRLESGAWMRDEQNLAPVTQ